MHASPAEQSKRGAARPGVIIVAVTAGWAAALACVLGYSGSRVEPVTPAVAVENANAVGQPAGFADVVEKIKPAVFGIKVRLEQQGGDPGLTSQSFGDDSLPRMGRPKQPGGGNSAHPRAETAQGAGFFISPDGSAITSSHVMEHSARAEITTDDGATYTARLVGTDGPSDLALLKVEGRADFPHVKLADRQPRIGDWVLAIGSPFGLGGTVTAGIVSARGRDIGTGSYDDFIQIDAPVNQGNSGGPSFDINGHVIGINTAIYSPTGGSVGIAFAVPADVAKGVIAQLRDKGTVTRGWAGLQIQNMTPDIADSLGLTQRHGALVAETVPGGPAAKAGITAGDVVTSVNATPLKDSRTLSRSVADAAPGAEIALGVVRDGKERTVRVTLGEPPGAKPQPAPAASPAAEAPPDLGLTLAPASQVRGGGGRGVVVMDTKRTGSEHGIGPGDVILEVAGKPVNSAGDVRSAVTNARRGGKRTVMMHVQSGATSRFVAVPVG